jgi:hypothetical protein
VCCVSLARRILETRAAIFSVSRTVLNESVLRDKLEEGFFGDEVVS